MSDKKNKQKDVFSITRQYTKSYVGNVCVLTKEDFNQCITIIEEKMSVTKESDNKYFGWIRYHGKESFISSQTFDSSYLIFYTEESGAFAFQRLGSYIVHLRGE